MRSANRPLRALALAVLGGAAVCGCGSSGPHGAGKVYPVRMEKLGTLNVQAFVDGSVRTLTITNTTSKPLGPGRLWLNAWFSRPMERLEIGETRSYALAEFRDEHGERIDVGGFFATEAPERLVRAELEIDSGLQQLVLVAESQRR